MLRQRLHLRRGATYDATALTVASGPATLNLADTLPATRSAFAAMSAPEGLDADSLAFDPALAGLVNRLEASGWVARTLLADDVPLVTREPVAHADVHTRQGVLPDVPLRLSRLAVLHDDDGRLVLVSGAVHAQAVLHDPRVAALLVELRTGRLPAEVGAGLADDEREAVLRLLLQAGLLVRLDDDTDPEQHDPSIAQWHPLDLAFHARNRLGRRPPGYGGTYPFKATFPEPPGRRAAGAGSRIALPRPDLEDVARKDPPLTEVVEGRRSTRVHDDAAPIDVTRLGELLYRTSRVREVRAPEGQGEYALRPYPNGGALYELDVYPVVRLCDGVPPGLYRYDGEAHELELVGEAGPAVDGLLEQARVAALMDAPPQVLLTVAARFPRVSWKYEGMPYSLTLKHVGVLYQTVYLVATAMELAVCGLGGGDSDLFARAAGLDYLAETSVGELIVGSVPPDLRGPALEAVVRPTPSF